MLPLIGHKYNQGSPTLYNRTNLSPTHHRTLDKIPTMLMKQKAESPINKENNKLCKPQQSRYHNSMRAQQCLELKPSKINSKTKGDKKGIGKYSNKLSVYVIKNGNYLKQNKQEDNIHSNIISANIIADKINESINNIGLIPTHLNNNISLNSSLNSSMNISTMGKFESTDGFTIKKITTAIKPAHRYKTCLLVQPNRMILYGGIGCERDLSWAKLNYEQMRWQFPQCQTSRKSFYKPQTPIFGHTMVQHKDKAIIFGGNCTTQVNETTIINTNNMSILQGERAPVRRKDHAAIMYGQYMLIHGGVQTKQTKSDFLAYHVKHDKWTILVCSSNPFLSSHRMASTKAKKKSKLYYIFGGLNQKGKCRNTLYSIKLSSEKQLRCQKIQTLNPPLGRHSFCFQGISQTHLLIYGGKQSSQVTDIENSLYKGVFNDIHLLNVDTSQWVQVQSKINMEYCFGMASSSLSNRMFIFGGSTPDNYCDASIYMISSTVISSSPYESAHDVNRNLEQDSDKKIRLSSINIASKKHVTE